MLFRELLEEIETETNQQCRFRNVNRRGEDGNRFSYFDHARALSESQRRQRLNRAIEIRQKLKP